VKKSSKVMSEDCREFRSRPSIKLSPVKRKQPPSYEGDGTADENGNDAVILHSLKLKNLMDRPRLSRGQSKMGGGKSTYQNLINWSNRKT
jgi:hypothetical protein